MRITITIRHLVAAFIAAAALAEPVVAAAEAERGTPAPQEALQEKTVLDIKTKVYKLSKPLPDDIRQKKLFVEFKESPRLSVAFGNMLEKKGYTVVQDIAAADLHLQFEGSIKVDGPGRTPVIKGIGEVAESAAEVKPGDPDYKGGANSGDSIAFTSLVTRSISVTDVVTWGLAKTGIFGWLNEVTTGDARGSCLGVKSCEEARKKLQQSASVMLTLKKDGEVIDRQQTRATTTAEQVVINDVIARAIELAVEPFDRPSQGSNPPSR